MLAINDDPPGVARRLAERVRLRRLELDYTQQNLARRAGMSLSTYRRFEATGEISLHRLILVGVALGTTSEFETLFQEPRYASLDEILDTKRRTRQRGARND
ncbi:MAG: helix-turn-helix domain-containing protein [Propionibacteriaceae bacterium]|jgi:transcriptional regulator with XRE-family HTH domain|nr:helix-turn-helix domain-containing protein [Propionibacteriaceae bacterium]